MIEEIREIENCLSRFEINKAINIYKQIFSISKSEYINEVLIISGKYARLKSQIRKGIISKQEEDLELSRIINSLLEIKDELIEHENRFKIYENLKVRLDTIAKKFKFDYPMNLKRSVIRRMVFVNEMDVEFKVLWIDDELKNIENEVRVFESMNVNFDLAISSEEATDFLAKNSKYDLIISDVGRNGNKFEGFEYALKLEGKIKNIAPFVFYTRYRDWKAKIPRKTFGIAIRPNDLFHFVFDVMERKF